MRRTKQERRRRGLWREREDMKEKWKRLVSPVVAYYRDLRPSNLRSRKYNHIFLLLYWIFYGLMFLGVERIFPMLFPGIVYHPVYCALDDLIPFCEWFVFPYYFWFAYLIVPGAIWFFWEPESFRNFMWSIILTYTTALVMFLVYPNMQELRPVDFERDNFMVDIVKGLYNFDTNTNVCPSVHVLGSVSVLFAAIHSRIFSAPGWQIFFWVSAVLISISTVFLRQHSVIDIFVAIGVAVLCYLVQFLLFPRLKRRKSAKG